MPQVTIEAIDCQKEIAKDIIGKEADYYLSLKDNQKNLYNAAINIFNAMENNKDFYQNDISNGNKIE